VNIVGLGTGHWKVRTEQFDFKIPNSDRSGPGSVQV